MKIGLFFLVLHVHKNYPMALLFNMLYTLPMPTCLSSFSLCFSSCAYFDWKLPGKLSLKMVKNWRKKSKMSLFKAVFLCLKKYSLKIYIITFIRSSSVQKMAFQAHYFLSYWQINIPEGKKYLLFDQISANKVTAVFKYFYC